MVSVPHDGDERLVLRDGLLVSILTGRKNCNRGVKIHFSDKFEFLACQPEKELVFVVRIHSSFEMSLKAG